MVLLIEKHDVRCMRVIVLHALGRRGFIHNALLSSVVITVIKHGIILFLKLLVKIITTCYGSIHQVQFSLHELYFLEANDESLLYYRTSDSLIAFRLKISPAKTFFGHCMKYFAHSVALSVRKLKL
jgi:hypothetical protein